MEVHSVFVTGANRGIGLEFVKQFVNLPTPPRWVFATYRNSDTNKALNAVRDTSTKSQVVLLKMDVTKADEIENAAKTVEAAVGEVGLTLLINNAGLRSPHAFPEVTDDNLLLHFHTNTLGPINVMKGMIPLLQRSADFHRDLNVCVSRAAVLNVSSEGGSISRCVGSTASIGYKMSKAALNMAMRLISVQTKDAGILVVQLCPGLVKTDMGSKVFGDVALEANESVSSILDTLFQLDASHHGAFVNIKGAAIPF